MSCIVKIMEGNNRCLTEIPQIFVNLIKREFSPVHGNGTSKMYTLIIEYNLLEELILRGLFKYNKSDKIYRELNNLDVDMIQIIYSCIVTRQIKINMARHIGKILSDLTWNFIYNAYPLIEDEYLNCSTQFADLDFLYYKYDVVSFNCPNLNRLMSDPSIRKTHTLISRQVEEFDRKNKKLAKQIENKRIVKCKLKEQIKNLNSKFIKTRINLENIKCSLIEFTRDQIDGFYYWVKQQEGAVNPRWINVDWYSTVCNHKHDVISLADVDTLSCYLRYDEKESILIERQCEPLISGRLKQCEVIIASKKYLVTFNDGIFMKIPLHSDIVQRLIRLEKNIYTPNLNVHIVEDDELNIINSASLMSDVLSSKYTTDYWLCKYGNATYDWLKRLLFASKYNDKNFTQVCRLTIANIKVQTVLNAKLAQAFLFKRSMLQDKSCLVGFCMTDFKSSDIEYAMKYGIGEKYHGTINICTSAAFCHYKKFFNRINEHKYQLLAVAFLPGCPLKVKFGHDELPRGYDSLMYTDRENTIFTLYDKSMIYPLYLIDLSFCKS